MSLIAVALTLLLLAIVIAVISGPLRRGRTPAEDGSFEGGSSEAGSSEREALLAEREAKYREIRDAELDYQTGKLSQADFEAIDNTLRAEAIDILDRLEALERP